MKIFDRENNDLLADQKTDNIKVTGLTPNTDYYFQIRSVDYSGNYSTPQDDITVNTTPYKINSFTAVNQSSVIAFRMDHYS